MEKKLTYREKLFCEEYVICLNGSEAAQKCGYSNKGNGARVRGQEMLAKPHVKEYIAELMKATSNKLEITKESCLMILYNIAINEESADRDRISSVATISKMLGFNDPKKVNLDIGSKQLKDLLTFEQDTIT